MRRTGDGKLIVLGNTMNYGAGNGDLWLLLLEENGTILWQKAVGGPQRDFAHDLQPAADGGYFIAGTTFSFGPGVERALLATVDKTGDIPYCTLPAFNVSDSTTEDTDISPTQRPFLTRGQHSSLVLSSSTLPPLDLSVSAASYCPPEPKLVLSERTIKMGPTSRNTRNQVQIRILNAGAADLTIKEMTMVKEQDSRSWFAHVWDWITRRPGPSFSVTHTCTSVASAHDCTCAVEFMSPSPGETQAMLTVISNDPDTPVMTVPVHAAVR